MFRRKLSKFLNLEFYIKNKKDLLLSLEFWKLGDDIFIIDNSLNIINENGEYM